MTKSKKLGAVIGIATALTSAVAMAAPTTWEFRGTVTGFEAGSANDIDIPIGVGSPFRVLVNFDTTTPLNFGTNAVGPRYFSNAPPNFSLVAYVGGFGPFIEKAPAGNITVRDRHTFTDSTGTTTVDGYSFGTTTTDAEGVTTYFQVILRGDNDDLVDGTNLLPLDPPAALTDPAVLAALPTALFQVCRTDAQADPPGACNRGLVLGRLAAVTTPSAGTSWTLTARDCQYIDTTTTPGVDAQPHDCIRVAPNGSLQLGYGRVEDRFTGPGIDRFDLTFQPASPFPGPSNGQSLGTVTGKVSFTGPAGLPILRGASLPSDISRTNSNLSAYQRYDYTGPATPMPLIVDLTYGIGENSVDPASTPETGLRAGGATIGAVLAIVDAAKVTVPQVASSSFNSITCGAEGTLGWPAGAILGSTSFLSPDGQRNPAAATVLDVRGCADPGQPVQLEANQSFIVASSMQTPARGKWTLNPNAPTANGYVDARNTMRVTFDPNAPPAVVQNLVDNIVPACTDCAPPEPVTAAVDVRPGDNSCINPKLQGVIPLAVLGSAQFRASSIRLDQNLKLGNLSPRTHGTRPQCSLQDVNADGYLDLVCHFENKADNWSAGQTSVTFRGKLVNGLPVTGTDAICVK